MHFSEREQPDGVVEREEVEKAQKRPRKSQEKRANNLKYFI